MVSVDAFCVFDFEIFLEIFEIFLSFLPVLEMISSAFLVYHQIDLARNVYQDS